MSSIVSPDGDGSATYVVECFTPGVTRDDVVAAARRAQVAATGLRASGSPIEYLGALLMPSDEVVFHLFRSTDDASVREAGNHAALEFTRVLESLVIEDAGHGVPGGTALRAFDSAGSGEDGES